MTGKGGTGKTTVTAALGLLAARRGTRTILCEVSGGQAALATLIEGDRHAEAELRVGPHLTAISIDPESAKLEYLKRQVRFGALAGILGSSSVFQLLTAASPGLDELLTIGKVWDLAQLEQRPARRRYDLVILDAPATGHALALLQAPRTYATSPASDRSSRRPLIDRFLHDRAAHRRGGGRAAGGDAGQRDDRAGGSAWRRGSQPGRGGRRTASTRSASAARRPKRISALDVVPAGVRPPLARSALRAPARPPQRNQLRRLRRRAGRR